MPTRIWSGPAEYRHAPAAVPPYKSAIRSGAAGDYLEGAHHLRLLLGGNGARAQYAFRLSDEKTLGLVEQRNTACGAGGGAETAPLLLTYSSSAAGIKIGRITSAKPIQWTGWLAYRPYQSAFGWRDGVGYAFRDGSIGAITDLSAADFTTLDSTPARVYSTAGRGDVGVWSVWVASVGHEVMKGFAASVPVSALVSQDGDVKTVAQSDDALAWVLANGPESSSGRYTSVALYTSPRPSSSSKIVPTKVADLGSGAGFAQLRIGGDFLATTGCSIDGADCAVHVAQISTKKTWRIGRRAGKQFLFLFSIANDELVLGESDDAAPDEIESLVRINVRKLDDVVKGTY